MVPAHEVLGSVDLLRVLQMSDHVVDTHERDVEPLGDGATDTRGRAGYERRAFGQSVSHMISQETVTRRDDKTVEWGGR